jgi:hypothetical protein
MLSHHVQDKPERLDSEHLDQALAWADAHDWQGTEVCFVVRAESIWPRRSSALGGCGLACAEIWTSPLGARHPRPEGAKMGTAGEGRRRKPARGSRSDQSSVAAYVSCPCRAAILGVLLPCGLGAAGSQPGSPLAGTFLSPLFPTHASGRTATTPCFTAFGRPRPHHPHDANYAGSLRGRWPIPLAALECPLRLAAVLGARPHARTAAVWLHHAPVLFHRPRHLAPSWGFHNLWGCADAVMGVGPGRAPPPLARLSP